MTTLVRGTVAPTLDAVAESWLDALSEIIDRSHVSAPEGLAPLVDRALAPLGISAEVFLIDLPQRHLRPVRRGVATALDVEAGVAGRSFRLGEIVAVGNGVPELWVPLVDGTARLGTVRLTLPTGTDPEDDDLQQRCWQLVGLLGHLVVAGSAYGDTFHVARRARPLSVASELLWQLLPPLTFATDQLVISAVLEPFDRIGGDGFDYAVDLQDAFFAIFDAVGHDIQAGLTTALTLAAVRNARRQGGTGLQDLTSAADEVIRREGPGARFVTAVLARLDVRTGLLRYLNAGHPPPLLLRASKTVKTLDGAHRVPLGVRVPGGVPDEVGVERLEPGDRLLLYTDGIVEARDATGREFGVDRLIDMAERSSAAGLPAPETLRRLSHTVQDHQGGELRDDATLLLVEWSSAGAQRLLPEAARLRGG